MNPPAERPSSGSYLLFRVDDRLLHGQVALGWGRVLRPRGYLIADDAAAADGDAEELLRTAVADGEEVRVAPVRVVAAGRGLPEPGGTVLLVRDLEAAARLLRAGVPGPVNLGGLHHRPGARPHLPYLYLTPGDEALLRDLAAGGVVLYAQDLPGNARRGLSEILP